jgi:type IX secretion system PorP/SprF family membrane protein
MLNKVKCFLVVSIQLLIIVVARGQQSSLYTQYMFNGLAINPAYAGSHEALSMTAFARKQWANVEGAPLSATFSAHTPIKKEKMGLGFLFSNDKISIFNQTSLSAIYAYRIAFSEHRKLSFGLQAGFNNYSVRYSQLTSKTANDPALPTSDFTSWSPNFGAGVYYYSQKLYIGLSVPFLASNILANKYVAQRLELKNNYFFTTGYVMKLSPDIKLKPSVLVKYLSGNPIQIDLNANVLFREVLWAGVSYRSFNALSFLTQVNITEQLRIGYSYDLSLGKLAGFNSGSHEFMINYLFSFTKTRVDTPRYF